MPVELKKRLLNVAEYHQMFQVGILTEHDRVELINGEIIAMSPIGSYHATAVNRINRVFHRLLGEIAIISVQNPIWLNPYSEPESDIALLAPPLEKYEEHHPQPDDIWLIVEIADSSYEYDRAVKLPLYAVAGIPQVWLINLHENQIEVFTTPDQGKYKLHQLMFPTDALILLIEGKEFVVSAGDILKK